MDHGAGIWAELIDGGDAPPRPLLGLSSAVEAAGVFAQALIEESQGGWTEGAIRVWNKDQEREGAAIFDITAVFAPAADDDAEEGDLDCELEIIKRD